MLSSLITKEDPLHIHKSLGIYCLLHYVYQFLYYYNYGTMNLHLLNIIPHILLHFSSFIFRVLDKRPVTEDNKIVKKMAMFIWEELRLHSLFFGTRSCLIILLPNCAIPIIYINMLLADGATFIYGNSNVTTVRGNLNIEKKSTIKQIYAGFFSTSQLGATIICGGFFQKTINPILVFSTLPAIQTSAFGMTLLRKNIISKEIWQIVYSMELMLVYIMWYLEYKNFDIIFISLLAYMLRRENINKYILWLCFYLNTKLLYYI